MRPSQLVFALPLALSLCLGVAWTQSITGGGEDGLLFAPVISSYSYTRDDFTVIWEDTSSTDEALDYLRNDVFSYLTTVGSIGDVLPGQQLAQLPVAGGAVVLVYNLTLASPLILNGTVIADIWSGAINTWDHPLILALNPSASISGPILLAYSDDGAGSISSVMRDYANSWTAGGQATVSSAAVQQPSSANRKAYVKANQGAITYLTLAEAQGMNIARIKTGSGAALTASSASIQNAMNSFTSDFLSGDTVLSIINAPSSTAWPISYISYITMRLNSNLTNCVAINEFMVFVSWMLLNNQAATQIADLTYSTLPISYRRTVLDSLSVIKCNGEQATSTSYIVGMGSPFNPFPALGYYYSSSSFKLKYFNGNSATSLSNLKLSTVDFGQSSTPVAETDLQQIGDPISVPGYSFAVTVAYNVPELIGLPTLKMNWEVIAGIYLGTVTTWDHNEIKALNPELENDLPPRAIRIVYQSNNSSITMTFNTAMSLRVPEYAQTIGFVSGFLDSPAIKNGSGVPVNGFGFPQMLDATTYSFGLTISQQLTKKVQGVALWNTHGNLVSPNAQSVLSAIKDNVELLNDVTTDTYTLYFSPGADSWPMVAINSMLFHRTNMVDCRKAKALVDWIYWMHTDSFGKSVMDSSGFVAPYRVPELNKLLLRKVTNVTCDGVHVSSVYGCVTPEGTLCSDRGQCNDGVCTCDDGWTGSLCEEAESKGSSSDALGIGLGVSLSSAFVLILLIALCLFVAALFLLRRRGEVEKDYIINYEELEIGDLLGEGGFGQVHRGQWRGNEVAIKLLPPAASNKRENREAFVREMNTMSKLRHPNVVLFMAACTKPPKMCIVMEFMTLGSLYDLLHNELVPELPMLLRVKLAYQAAKGMHFLHSSNIVHRDLKSLNLLLDNKWNLKVSDFGLTCIRDMVGNDEQMACSVPWTAPEVLERYHRRGSEAEGVDYMMADVYSFGIILWEILTRNRPYFGLSAPQIAVSVIRDNARPHLDMENDNNPEYISLMTSCWHREAMSRPVFMDVMKTLHDLCDTYSSGSSSYYRSAASSSSSRHSSNPLNSTSTSTESDKEEILMESTPTKDVSFLVFDLAGCDELWRTKPIEAERCIKAYMNLVKKSVAKHGGVLFSGPVLHSGGTLMAGFSSALRAVNCAARVQRRFPERSRVAMHHSAGPAPFDKHKGYAKEKYGEACRLATLCPEGSVLCSKEAQAVLSVATMPDDLSLSPCEDASGDQVWRLDWEGSPNAEPQPPRKNDVGLCSSNSCPWIIDSSLISEGQLIGRGSYGLVREATYLNRKVAMKRLYNSRLTEEQMLSMRREAATTSELAHPNIVSLIGMCISEQGPIILMEIVPHGSLDRLLRDRSVKLSWPKRLSMLRDAALGISYLHSRGVIHRDIKSSNLLIDEDLKVKVGDFGFATVTQNDCTMTRCGTPAWTAPEVMNPQHDKYNEKVDVYSFGIVMWEVLTRSQPYTNKNGLSVAFDVISGDRPEVPEDTDPQFAEFMQRCWHRKPGKRPQIDELVVYFNSALGSFDV